MDNYQIARRAQIGVIIPSTNTGVEYDLQKFGLDGVTWHPSRFYIELRNWADEVAKTGEDVNQVFERFLEIMRGEIPGSIRNAMSAKVKHIMLGMSAETFWGGLEGNIAFEQEIRDQIDEFDPTVGLTTGAGATKDALELFGAKKISVITPYPQVGDDNVIRFFSDIGFDVHKVKGLNRPSATAIAETSIKQVVDAIHEVDADDVDCIIQCGTNLSTIDIFPAYEHILGKPMVPINVATVWHALRACGINDKITGMGRLLEEF